MPDNRSNKISCNNYQCEIEIFLELVSGKWVSLILWELMNYGTKRFGQLKKDIPGITQKMLTQQLRYLEKNDIVKRTVYPEVPPVVEYTLTEVGMAIKPIFISMDKWGKDYMHTRNKNKVE